nr:hypothetical protein [Tanacetum cinerariifolium]
MTNKKRQSERKPKLLNKFNDHVMNNMSQNRNDVNNIDEDSKVRVDKEEEVEEIEENSNVMDEVVIKSCEKVDCVCDNVSESKLKNGGQEIGNLSKEMNKGVFGWVDKEFKECNVMFGSMDKNEVEKDMEYVQKSISDEPIDNNRNGVDNKIGTTSWTNVNKPSANQSVTSNENVESYAKTTEKIKLDKNLFNIPTGVKDNGEEVVIFNEEIVEEGSKKFRLYDVISNENNVWLFKFRHSEGMNTIGIKVLGCVNGISTLASRLGKPLVMDDMTANMCHNGKGRSAYARVLVEIEATKGFKDIVEIQYRDKNDCLIRTKCLKNGVKRDQVENNNRKKVNHNSEGFVEVRSRKVGYHGMTKDKGKALVKDNTTIFGKEEVNEKIQYKYVPKHVNTKIQVGPESNKQMNENQFTILRFKTNNVEELRRSANKYSVLADEEVNEVVNVCIMENENKSKEDFVNKENEGAKNLVADEIERFDAEVSLMIVYISKQAILCVIESIEKNVKFFCSFIYASNSGRKRKKLWNELQAHKDIANNRPCVLMGDFNVTLTTNENYTGGSFMNGDMIEFNECVNKLELKDICSTGFQFTWTKHLKNPNSSIMKKLKKRRSFRFVNYIADKEEFADCVSKGWELEKAKIKWLSEGDQNITYFHGILKSRKYKGRIDSICDENSMRFDGDNVANVFIEHFKNFLGSKHDVQSLETMEVNFDKVLSRQEAEDMICLVTDEEIKEVVFNIDSNKAYGLDGYTSGKKLLDLRNRIKNHVYYSIGDGNKVYMWFDKWDPNRPVCDLILRRIWYGERYSDKETVAYMLDNGVWVWPAHYIAMFPKLRKIVVLNLSNGTNDKVYWLDNQNDKKEFSTKQVWIDLRDNVEKVNWHHVVWYSQFQPRHAFLLWLAIKERLATQDRLANWNCQINDECPLCQKERDSHSHLFFKCEFANQIWERLKEKMGNIRFQNELKSIVALISQTKAKKNIGRVVNRLVLAAAVYLGF